MYSKDYLIPKKNNIEKTINVIDLMNKAKIAQKKEKRQTILVAAIAASALAISGFVISL